MKNLPGGSLKYLFVYFKSVYLNVVTVNIYILTYIQFRSRNCCEISYKDPSPELRHAAIAPSQLSFTQEELLLGGRGRWEQKLPS